jgi:hypothetical protein
MAAAGGTGEAAAVQVVISSPVSPDQDDVPGVLGRLLQRAALTPKASKRFSRRTTRSSVALRELSLSEADESPLVPARSRIPEVAADCQGPRSTAPDQDAGDIAQPQPQQSCPTGAPHLKMPSATPQPQLRKKASFRDRLKAWQKPPQPLEIVTEELKPRFVYEPTHAAADFSRLAVSPLSPTKPRLPSTATHTPPERDASAPARNKQPQGPQPGHGDEPRDDEPTRRHSRPSVNRHSSTLVEDPFQASNTAAHVPVSSRPVAWSPGEQASSARREPPPPPSSPQPLSDFEVFLARAEAEDRERREQVLRSISQRSAAYAANRVRPDPHRQFAVAGSPTAEKISKGSVEKNERPAQRNSKTRYALAPRASTEAQQQQPPEREEQRRRDSGRKSHARQSSWAASYTTGSSAGEKGPVLLPPKRQARPLPEPPKPVRADVVGKETERPRDYQPQPQPPRTLRRQASLTQRLVQYIRPPKTAARPIETLVE